MNRISAAARPCLLLIASAVIVTAQEPAPVPQTPDDLRALRESIEQQNKQIEALTQQITELNRRLSAQKPPAPTPVPAPPPSLTPPVTAQPPAPQPAAPQAPAPQAPAAATPTPAAPPQAGTPDATAASGGLKHTVAKGETLTSIAKRYNIPLSELEKANPITDDRKLQIGHVLNIPTAPNKAPEPQTEKKENP